MKFTRMLPLALAMWGLSAPASMAGQEQAKTHVVAVGQAYIEKAIRLRETPVAAANQDVDAVVQAFREHGAEVHTLVEEQLTRPALKAMLEEVGKAMKPQDSLVFYFNGFSELADDVPFLFVQGSGETALIPDGSRRIPLEELRGWLAGTGATSLAMFVNTGPGATMFCGPWAKPGSISALTSVCVNAPPKQGEVGELAKLLADGLKGAADANGDHSYSSNELAGWLRVRLSGTVYQTGPVKPLIGRKPNPGCMSTTGQGGAAESK